MSSRKQRPIAALLGGVSILLAIAVAVALRKGPGVDIYPLRSGSVDSPLHEVVLQDEPWIACEEIARYDGSTHSIYLREGVDLVWPEVSPKGTPFAVTVGGEPCYLGVFWSLGSSFLPPEGTAIVSTGSPFLAPDVVRIEHGWDPAEDVRNHPRVIRALKRHGQYRAGLECYLDNVIVSANKGSLTYTYTLRNPDREALYVLDPDRLGTEGFHYFTNGVLLSTGPDSPTLRARPRAVSNPRTGKRPGQEIDEKWFYLLRGGQSMTRTVVLDGYPTIAPGTYECLFVFPSPPGVTRERRMLPGGRVWLGELQAKATIHVAAE